MLIPIPVDLPPHLVSATPGDVDADGREELILVSEVPQGHEPDSVKLTVWNVDSQTGLGERQVVDLGNEPLIWDVWGGLWGTDGEGLIVFNLATGDAARVATLATPLAGLGPTTPVQSRFAHDLSGDGDPELVVHSEGRYHVYRSDGTSLGAVEAPARGELRQSEEQGGAVFQASQAAPALVVTDVDGDGLKDLVLPRGRELVVHRTGASAIGVSEHLLELPVDLEPREELRPRKDEERRRITRVWLQDLDGDGKLDLGLHRMVVSGSWFGTTAELLFAAGTGDGFAVPQVVSLDTASFFGLALDADGDGDTDLLVPQMDTGLTSLGRALVTKALPVDVDLFSLGSGGYVEEPQTLLQVSQQVEGREGQAWVYSDESDVDGDGLPDLVIHLDDALRVYLARDGFDDGKPSFTVDVPLPDGGELLVHDVTGDGRAEVLLWAPRETRGTLLVQDSSR